MVIHRHCHCYLLFKLEKRSSKSSCRRWTNHGTFSDQRSRSNLLTYFKPPIWVGALPSIDIILNNYESLHDYEHFHPFSPFEKSSLKKYVLGGGFKFVLLSPPFLGVSWSNLTTAHIFQMGVKKTPTTVDGSEIRQSPPGMFKKILVNNGRYSTTNLNWCSPDFLNHQQLVFHLSTPPPKKKKNLEAKAR